MHSWHLMNGKLLKSQIWVLPEFSTCVTHHFPSRCFVTILKMAPAVIPGLLVLVFQTSLLPLHSSKGALLLYLSLWYVNNINVTPWFYGLIQLLHPWQLALHTCLLVKCQFPIGFLFPAMLLCCLCCFLMSLSLQPSIYVIIASEMWNVCTLSSLQCVERDKDSQWWSGRPKHAPQNAERLSPGSRSSCRDSITN